MDMEHNMSIITLREPTTDELELALRTYKTQVEEGGFDFNGIHIPTDEKTERRIFDRRPKAEADPAYTIPDWTTDGGETSVTLTAEMIIAISNAFDSHIQKCFTALTGVRAELEQLDSEEDIKNAFDAAYSAEQGE
tara:strand:- start:3751 stop:4158 length:408 start_codon:yes stop_codon:yes gene_type:complete